jgi:hypothetical protein
MRTIDKIYNVTARNKLVVTKDHAVIRFNAGDSDVQRSRVEKFLTRVAEEAPIHEKTLRGHLAYHRESDTFYIVLMTSNKNFSERFYEHKN